MAKKKKTKKQKILSDLRHQSTQSNVKEPDFPVYSLPVQNPASQTRPVPNSSMSNASSAKTSVIALDSRHLTADLRKTVLLTISIVIVELLIKFLSKI